MKTILFFCFTLMTTFSWAQERQVNQHPKKNVGWETEQTATYAIEYPQDWTLNKSGLMGSTLILFSPPSSPDDQFKENVNLMVQDLSGMGIDLDNFTEISTKQIETLITDGKIEFNKRIKKPKNDYHKIIYTGKQGVFSLKFEQYYWIVNDKAYILTFTCKESSFEEYQKLGEKILDSFRIEG